MTHKGWIVAPLEDKPLLEGMGIRLGPFDADEIVFNDCEVPDEAMESLNPLWGRIYWGLDEGTAA